MSLSSFHDLAKWLEQTEDSSNKVNALQMHLRGVWVMQAYEVFGEAGRTGKSNRPEP